MGALRGGAGSAAGEDNETGMVMRETIEYDQPPPPYGAADDEGYADNDDDDDGIGYHFNGQIGGNPSTWTFPHNIGPQKDNESTMGDADSQASDAPMHGSDADERMLDFHDDLQNSTFLDSTGFRPGQVSREGSPTVDFDEAGMPALVGNMGGGVDVRPVANERAESPAPVDIKLDDKDDENLKLD